MVWLYHRLFMNFREVEEKNLKAGGKVYWQSVIKIEVN